MTEPPGLAVEESPRADVSEPAPSVTRSPATSSITPFCSRTEPAWTMPDWFTTWAWIAMVPASATSLPKLSTLPPGSEILALRPRPSGRSETSTSLPA